MAGSGLDGRHGKAPAHSASLRHPWGALSRQIAGRHGDLPPTPWHGDALSTRFRVWCSLGSCLIIPMITWTIQVVPSGPAATDGTPHLSRTVPTVADWSDTGQPP